MKTIIHKNSGDLYSDFPHYCKLDGIYGDLFIANDLAIIFMYLDGDCNIQTIDVSDQFILLNQTA